VQFLQTLRPPESVIIVGDETLLIRVLEQVDNAQGLRRGLAGFHPGRPVLPMKIKRLQLRTIGSEVGTVKVGQMT
jgi:hypothetical protein